MDPWKGPWGPPGVPNHTLRTDILAEQKFLQACFKILFRELSEETYPTSSSGLFSFQSNRLTKRKLTVSLTLTAFPMNTEPVALLLKALVWFSSRSPLWYCKAIRAVTPEPVGLLSTCSRVNEDKSVHHVPIPYCLAFVPNVTVLIPVHLQTRRCWRLAPRCKCLFHLLI